MIETILVIAAIVLAILFFARALANDDTLELTDSQAKRVERELEEKRKKLVECEEKDVELDHDNV